VSDASDFLVLAVNELAAAAGIAGEIMTSVPSDSDPLAGLPVAYVGADGVDATGDLMSGNARVLDARPMTLFYERIAVADPAGFDLNADLVSSRIGNISFDKFEITAGLADLDGFHFWHASSLVKFRLVGISMEFDNAKA
jgi:hypothetical protein